MTRYRRRPPVGLDSQDGRHLYRRDAWGIDDGYVDASGSWRDVGDDTAAALQAAMGADPDDPEARPTGVAPVRVVPVGEGPSLDDPGDPDLGPGRLELEDGSQIRVDDRLPPDLPIGYHDLHRPGRPPTRLVVTPGRCHLPTDARQWLLAAQLYACRSGRSWGIGDFGDLGTVIRWAAEQGAGMVALNPLHAPLPTRQVQPSPYTPSSRRWLNPLYLAIDQIPGADDPGVTDLGATARALESDRIIHHDRVWHLKKAALDLLWTRPGADGGFDEALDRWAAGQGDDLTSYARFCALAEHFDRGWSGWPPEYRHPDSPAVARFAADRPDRVRFWMWVQKLLHDQLHTATGDTATGATATGDQVGILHDLAIGVDPDGADAWIHQDLLALDTHVGAPPDLFNTAGQDWGLPPFIPWKLRAARYRPLAELWRAAMSAGQGLRIDHAMGLYRLWWIPSGHDARSGGYVRYAGDELLAVLAVESVRSGAVVVGEDLGTVEEEVRRALLAAGVLSTRVLWFDELAPEHLPEQALSTVTTHDLPTVAGIWTGADAAEQRSLDRHEDAERTADLRGHLQWLAGVGHDAALEDVILGVYDRVAHSPSLLVAATVEDLAALPERPNLPGTTFERPNWKLSLPDPVDKTLSRPLAHHLAARLRSAGR